MNPKTDINFNSKTRREFIKTISLSILGAEIITFLPVDAFASKDSFPNGFEIQKGFTVFNPTIQKNIVAFTESILPGSEKLGIKETLMRFFYANKHVAGFFDAGFYNLHAVSMQFFKKGFFELKSNDQKNKIIKHVSTFNRGFYSEYRKLIIEIYYSNPQTWKKLNYDGPPQPRGFLDYTEAPKK